MQHGYGKPVRKSASKPAHGTTKGSRSEPVGQCNICGRTLLTTNGQAAGLMCHRCKYIANQTDAYFSKPLIKSLKPNAAEAVVVLQSLPREFIDSRTGLDKIKSLYSDIKDLANLDRKRSLTKTQEFTNHFINRRIARTMDKLLQELKQPATLHILRKMKNDYVDTMKQGKFITLDGGIPSRTLALRCYTEVSQHRALNAHTIIGSLKGRTDQATTFLYTKQLTELADVRAALTGLPELVKTSFRINVGFSTVNFNSTENEVTLSNPNYVNQSMVFKDLVTITNNQKMTDFINAVEEKLQYMDDLFKINGDTGLTKSGMMILGTYEMNVKIYTIPHVVYGAVPEQIANKIEFKKSNSIPQSCMVVEGDKNLCLFNCIAAYIARQKKTNAGPTRYKSLAKDLFKKVYPCKMLNKYPGAKISEIQNIASALGYNIAIYSIWTEDAASSEPSGSPEYHLEYQTNIGKRDLDPNAPVKNSTETPETINLLSIDVVEGDHTVFKHLSLITELDKIARKYVCPGCGAILTDSRRISDHTCGQIKEPIFDKEAQPIMPMELTIRTLNERYNLELPELYPHFITYDFESILAPMDVSTGNTQIVNVNRPVSVSIYCEMTNELVHIVDKDPDALIIQFMNTLFSMADDIVRKVSELENIKRAKRKRDYVDLMKWVTTVPIIGFNSGGYDINLIKKYVLCRTASTITNSTEKGSRTIRMNVKRIGIDTVPKKKEGETEDPPLNAEISLIDIMSHVAAGTNMDKYCEMWNTNLRKDIFPYEWFTSYDKLYEPQLPPIEAFNSKLKGVAITDAQYAKAQATWKELNMKNMFDWLKYYNNLDVVPLHQAITKHREVLNKLSHADLLKDYMTLPATAYDLLWRTMHVPPLPKLPELPKIDMSARYIDMKIANYKKQDDAAKRLCTITANQFINLVNDGDRRCYYCRCEINHTNLTLDRLDNAVGHTYYNCKLCCKECNVRRADHYTPAQFRNLVRCEKYSEEFFWSFPETHKKYYDKLRGGLVAGQSLVFHRYAEAGVTRIQRVNWNKVTVQFERAPEGGVVCVVLGLDCNSLYPAALKLPMPSGIPYPWDVDSETLVNQPDGTSITESDILIRKLKADAEATTEFAFGPETMTAPFGFYEVDIHVPTDLYEKFGEFQPIFKNEDIPMNPEAIGYYMHNVATFASLGKKGTSADVRRNLIGSYHGTNHMVYYPLLIWYLKHGLEITKIHSVIQYHNSLGKFDEFVDFVANERRVADKVKAKFKKEKKELDELKDDDLLTPEQAARWREINDKIAAASSKADLYKNILNSMIGKTMMDRSKQDTVKYGGRDMYNKYVTNPLFKGCEEFRSDDVTKYEIRLNKKQIKNNLPIQVGIAVYHNAKLIMLRFYYDFLQKYIPRDRWQLIETDTDSLYMTLAAPTIDGPLGPHELTPEEVFKRYYSGKPLGPNGPTLSPADHLEALVPEELCESFRRDSANYLPRTDTEEHNMYDNRTPGLFKTEAFGKRIIALCSKTYFLEFFEPDKNGHIGKFASKGVQKNQNRGLLSFDNFKRVLTQGSPMMATNRGMRYGGEKYRNCMVTYVQQKTGLTPIYVKKRVDDDGVLCWPTSL